MGCVSSKQVLRRDRSRPTAPLSRTNSLPVRFSIGNASARRNVTSGDEHRHVVARASSTIGSLSLDSPPDISSNEKMMKSANDRKVPEQEGPLVVKEVKAWSDMIERHIPRTATMTPTDEEPETIDAWDLMADLEDASPIHPAAIGRVFSFRTSRDVLRSPEPIPMSPEKRTEWMHQFDGAGDPFESDFDSEMISFQKAVEELPPKHSLAAPQSAEREEKASLESAGGRRGRETSKSTGIVSARVSAFQQRINAKREIARSKAAKVAPNYKSPPEGKKKVVFYFTSLRGVRKTYEDCWEVCMILKSYGVRVDERDVSMHSGFKEELMEALGQGYGGKGLPRVFVDGNYLGGAEDVRQMHENGELRKALEGCEIVALRKNGAEAPCEGCSDVRFVPCKTCSGSCKVYIEEEEDEDEAEAAMEREELGGFRRCPDCNENGLVRCPICC